MVTGADAHSRLHLAVYTAQYDKPRAHAVVRQHGAAYAIPVVSSDADYTAFKSRSGVDDGVDGGVDGEQLSAPEPYDMPKQHSVVHGSNGTPYAVPTVSAPARPARPARSQLQARVPLNSSEQQYDLPRSRAKGQDLDV